MYSAESDGFACGHVPNSRDMREEAGHPTIENRCSQHKETKNRLACDCGIIFVKSNLIVLSALPLTTMAPSGVEANDVTLRDGRTCENGRQT